ncbi:hypothetical protein AB0O22_15745 [Streptomyces sp. NPDC091204]|uniref:hypothetical protein n=1 Tax=Streptomyces sp. NPDC091204 TaxID=3155299 RepID=UPI003446CFCA
MNTRLSSADPHPQSSTDPHRLLALCLNDHLAGADSGVSLIRRMARAHRNTPAGPMSAELAAEIADDRDSLREFMSALDVTEQWPRVAVDRLLGRAARQESVLESLRVEAARRTFATTAAVAATGRAGPSRRRSPGRAGWAS